MVLLVPDDVEDVTEDVTPKTDVPEQPKAQLDDSEASKATQKVDLDLDDAPFLEDEDDEEILEEVEEETPLFEQTDKESKFGLLALLKNKVVLIGSCIILLLLIVILFLIFREPEAPPPPPPPVQPQVPEEAQPAEDQMVEETPQILIRLDPFLIEQKDEQGNIRFLEIRVLVSTEDDGLARQFKQETYTVRNALSTTSRIRIYSSCPIKRIAIN